MVRKLSGGFALLVLLVLCIAPFTAQAQEVLPIGYNTSAVNHLNAPGDMVDYTFNGNIGDLVTIRAVGISAGADPNLALVGPSQQVLATNENVVSIPASTDAQIIFRLQESGPYYIVVSGTAGDFLLTLQGTPATPLLILDMNVPVTLTLPATVPAQSYVFNTDPIFPTTILIDSNPFNVDAFVELRDGTGQIISTLRGALDNACISVEPGDQLLELTVSAQPNITGAITLTLSNAPCAFGPVPAEPPVMPTPAFTPVAIEGVCAASSDRNVNIRSGPGTNYARLALLQAFQPIPVTGQSDNGQWLVVQNEFIQGWVSLSVVDVSGPCAQLPVVAAPPLPVASPTPGFPAIVVITPVVVTATPGVIILTATPIIGQPTGTLPPPPPSTATLPPPTAVQPTASPTITVTPTATVTPG